MDAKIKDYFKDNIKYVIKVKIKVEFIINIKDKFMDKLEDFRVDIILVSLANFDLDRSIIVAAKVINNLDIN